MQQPKSQVIKCSNCGRELCTVLENLMKPNKWEDKIVVHCWDCGDKSFAYTVKNYFYVAPTKESEISNVDQTFNEGPNTITITTVKK